MLSSLEHYPLPKLKRLCASFSFRHGQWAINCLMHRLKHTQLANKLICHWLSETLHACIDRLLIIDVITQSIRNTCQERTMTSSRSCAGGTFQSEYHFYLCMYMISIIGIVILLIEHKKNVGTNWWNYTCIRGWGPKRVYFLVSWNCAWNTKRWAAFELMHEEFPPI